METKNTMELYVIKENKNEDGVVEPVEYYDELTLKYEKQAEKHNKMVDEDILADSGFDIFIPPAPVHKESNKQRGWVNANGNWFISPRTTVKIPLGVKIVRTSTGLHPDGSLMHIPKQTRGYYVYPRSSIYKTSMRLANCTGIIDAGYRGELMAVFDNISDIHYELKPYTRLLQACSPDLAPFNVEIVNKDFSKTVRGAGGLGSTGE